MKAKILKALASATLALSALLAGMIYSYQNSTPPTRPSIAPKALEALLGSKLPDADGQPHGLDTWKGKTLVINFWATWCPPCRAEMPLFTQMHEAYKEHNVQFVGIAIDQADKVQAFRKELPISYPLLIGGHGFMERLPLLGNPQKGLPYTLIIRPDGQVQSQRLGRLEEPELRQQLELAEKPHPQPR